MSWSIKSTEFKIDSEIIEYGIHMHINRIFLLFIVSMGCSASVFSDVPAAINNLSPNQWQPISLNTIADLNPCPDEECSWSGSEGQLAVTDAWTGGAYASEVGSLGALVYAGGGHNAYYGNEVYVFDLQTLTWQRRNNPTDGKTPGDPSTFNLDANCRFWDGSPVVPHTYDSVVYDPESNRFIMLTPSDAASHVLPGRSEGCDSTIPAYFDLTTNAWGSMKSAGPGGLTDGPTAYDHKRKLFWGRTGFRDPRLLVSYDPAKDKWESYEDEPINIDSMGAIDPTRDLFVTANFRYNAEITVHDLSRPSKPGIYIQTIGDKQIEQSAELGFEWADKLGGFIAWNNGQDLYLLTPPNGNWQKNSWEWTRITGRGENPGVVSNGAYSKFQWIDSLGIAVIAPRIDAPVYAIRLNKESFSK